MEIKMFNKFKGWIIGIFSVLGTILLLFTFKKKNPKKIKEIEDNKKEIASIESDLKNLDTIRKEAKKKLKKLEKTADGRSKKVKAAKAKH